VEWVLHCECGFEARAADEVGLAAEIRRHALDAHRMPLSDDEALELARRGDHGTEGKQPRREER
jgi:predicted small metal-binding protein